MTLESVDPLKGEDDTEFEATLIEKPQTFSVCGLILTTVSVIDGLPTQPATQK